MARPSADAGNASTAISGFTTYEYIEHAPLTIVKRDGSREPFDRGKLLGKIQLACYKTPVSSDQIEELVDQIEGELGNLTEKEVPSIQVGELGNGAVAQIERSRLCPVCVRLPTIQGQERFCPRVGAALTHPLKSPDDVSPAS